MKSEFLFPHAYKKFAYCMLVPCFILLVLMMLGIDSLNWLDDSTINFTTLAVGVGPFGNSPIIRLNNEGILFELLYILTLGSLSIICFSKEAEEDEFMYSLRLRALVWSFKVFTLFLILATWFCFGFVYLYVVLFAFILFHVLFIVRFQLYLYQMRRNSNEE